MGEKIAAIKRGLLRYITEEAYGFARIKMLYLHRLEGESKNNYNYEKSLRFKYGTLFWDVFLIECPFA